ncbi:DNA mismatch repair protein msh3 [Wickerhamiella sorbophila]|uniref:DNA mismatch repair protein MSH3 n=1 Tax=Wickerhamiella sorbophila TaxID=45607 RepID=A0A2T0FKC9_9ASCO|nr:DNA mismatch repair protein msh3 [Wickerhamiella sorbophila]PRT55446.1 DNA mismatch repair protein msh3 [Wickerhamiella sorbophila]
MTQATIQSLFAKRPAAKPDSGDVQPHKKANISKLSSFRAGEPTDPEFSAKYAERRARFASTIGRSRTKRGTPGQRKLDAVGEQFMELKNKNPDKLLIIEVGYKFQILGADAVDASRCFGWTAISGWTTLDAGGPQDALYNRFAMVSFPTAKLSFYTRKLVSKGYKVGIVRQMETAAIKASERRSGPMRRELANVYTQGTYIDEDSVDDGVSGHVLALKEDVKGQSHRFSMISVHLATGDMVYDEFEDSSVVIELETRLMHIQPAEILAVGQFSSVVRRLIDQIQSRGSVRVITANGESSVKEYSQLQLSPALQECSRCLLYYLTEFGLQTVFQLPNLQPFSLQSHMQLNGNTLTSLEIFNNVTDYTARGSLFWVLDNTCTAMGKRLLKKWVAQPLLDRNMLTARVDAVEELVVNYNQVLESVRSVMTRLPDLERALLQIHYGRISRRQLYWTLHFFDRIAKATTLPYIQHARFKSPILIDLLEQLPKIRDLVAEIYSSLSPTAKEGGKLDFFNQDPPEVTVHKEALAQIEAEFDSYLQTAKLELGVDLKYVSINMDEYLVEISKSDAKKVPTEWRKMSGTQKSERFRTPATLDLIKRRLLEQERLEIACDKAYSEFVARVSQHHTQLRSVIVTLAQLDCLMSLAAVSRKSGYVRVDYVDEPCLEIVDGRHPMIEALISTPFIPNDVSMYPSRSRTMIVTGPNMGGKSSYVRQVALIAIMAQIGAFVPAKKARMSMMDAVFTRMGAYDNMMRGESTCMVELKECSDILASATERSLVLLDEIGRGTCTVDGMAIAYAVLDYMVSEKKSFTLFITHYPLLTKLADLYPKIVTNWCMQYEENKETKLVTLLYKLMEGVAYRSYGLNVARLANVDDAVLEVAASKSAEFERRLENRKIANKLFQLLSNLPSSIKDLKSYIK